jgi:hypothetical protein
LSKDDKTLVEITKSVLMGYVARNVKSFLAGRRDPPGAVDCLVLATAEVKNLIVATDDLNMYELGKQFSIATWHGYDVLKRMHAAKLLSNSDIQEIYAALEVNLDLPTTWVEAKCGPFRKVFR